jgi:16S rRNA (adenine1518-N6/adenine1519-N6)-dimethyltransferase
MDQGALKRIISISDLVGDETVVEIGAGLGSLTYHLSLSARRVIAVEFDERLVSALESVLQFYENVELVIGDILRLNLEDLVGGGSYQIIANIPYNITSLLIRRLLETPNPPSMVILTIQREVAERIVALPGQLSLLALSVQVYGEPNIKGHIPAQAFYPQPKVDSSILRIDLHETPKVPQALLPTFFQLAKVGFNQRRKQLKNSIAGGLGVSKDVANEWLMAAEIDPKQRPQELDIEAWLRLTEKVSQNR